MPTSFREIDGRLLEFALGLGQAGRIFTSLQLGRHPDISWRSLPDRRATEFLNEHLDVFEKIRASNVGRNFWRIKNSYKNEHGLNYRNVGISQRVNHWLAFGDLWMQLVFNGMRPEQWFTEGKQIGGFDIFMIVRNVPYMVEMQLTPLTQKDWRQKWYRRAEWLETKPWNDHQWANQFTSVKPNVLCVTREQMSNIQIPESGVLYIPTIERVPSELQKMSRIQQAT